MFFINIMLGLLLGYVIFFLMNAVLTLIFGKILGYKFLSFVFYFLYIKKENGRLKISVGNTQLASECGMYKENSTLRDTVLYSLFPCVMGFGAAALMLILCGRLGLAKVWSCAGAAYLGFSFFNAFLVADLIKKCTSKDPKSLMWQKTHEISNKLQAGIRPGDIEIKDEPVPKDKTDIYSLRYYLFLYYHYLETYNYDKLRDIVTLFEINMPNTHANYYTPYIYETIFYYSYINLDIEKAQGYYSAIEDNLRSDKDVNGRRIYAYYLYYTNKGKAAALKAAKEGLAAVDSFPHRGLAIMEKELLEMLIIEIGEEN